MIRCRLLDVHNYSTQSPIHLIRFISLFRFTTKPKVQNKDRLPIALKIKTKQRNDERNKERKKTEGRSIDCQDKHDVHVVDISVAARCYCTRTNCHHLPNVSLKVWIDWINRLTHKKLNSLSKKREIISSQCMNEMKWMNIIVDAQITSTASFNWRNLSSDSVINLGHGLLSADGHIVVCNTIMSC